LADLSDLLGNLLFILPSGRLKPQDVFQTPVIFRLQVPMQRVQAVQFRFELQPQLDFFLMGFQTSGDLLFEFAVEAFLLGQAFSDIS
jgi:hypothetical protein